MKKGVGSGSLSQRYGSANPDPHQNVMVFQHWRTPNPDPDPEVKKAPAPESVAPGK